MNDAHDPFASVREEAATLVAQMTTEKKARFCSGMNFWRLNAQPIE